MERWKEGGKRAPIQKKDYSQSNAGRNQEGRQEDAPSI